MALHPPSAGDSAVATPSRVVDNTAASTSFSLEVNSPATGTTQTPGAESAATEANQTLVEQKVLPEVGFLQQQGTTSDSQPGSSVSPEAPGVDRPNHSTSRPDVSVPADGSKFDVNDVAKRLAAAAQNPEEMQRIFSDAAARFGQANPLEPGSTFARQLTDALKATPGNHGLSVEFEGSEGVRDGQTATRLRQNDGTGSAKTVAESEIQFLNPSTPAERDSIASKLAEMAPSFVAQLPNRDTLTEIVNIANDLAIASRQGKDVGQLFQDAALNFNLNNPGVPGSVYASLLTGAMQLNPLPTTNLIAGYSGSEGIKSGSALVHLIDSTLPKGKQYISRVPMSFSRDI